MNFKERKDAQRCTALFAGGHTWRVEHYKVYFLLILPWQLSCVTLAEQKSTRAPPPERIRERHKPMSLRKILLVDDSETVLQVEQMILASRSYQTIVAHDGKEALAKALDCKPDLILMDVIMPGINGLEAVKQLRDNQQTRSVPIIMVTSKAEAEAMETGYQNGCNDYIVKPIDHAEFLAKIENLLGE